jgi:uncharacterized membrane protein YkgB
MMDRALKRHRPPHRKANRLSMSQWLLSNAVTPFPPISRASLAVIFVWFGLLKVCGVSPAAELVSRTFFFIPARIIVPTLGAVEVAIGLCFLFPRLLAVGLVLLALHLPGTFLSLIVVPQMCFDHSPFLLTTNGEFIVKNLLLISAALFLAGTLQPKARP